MPSNPQRHRDDAVMFDAYVSLRRIAQEYGLEDHLSIPRVVFVGETSSGKSMLVQNFLGFPCAFSKSDVGTRCPVLYRLRYNPNLADGEIQVKHPPGINRKEDLAIHLGDVMADIGRRNADGFQPDEYLVHIESKEYRDFEILDVPGLIGGSKNPQREEAVERITEHYVRNPQFLIVQLKEASQLPENSFGMRRIRELCLAEQSLRGSSFPARTDYEKFTITIQTKFDGFMNDRQHPVGANADMEKQLEFFNEQTLFTSMIFDGYDFGIHADDENTDYIKRVPELEKKRVDEWIKKLNRLSSGPNGQGFDESRFRPLIGIDIVRNQIQDMWVKAFRSALPSIIQKLRQLTQDAKEQYANLISAVEEKDLTTIRDTYLGYIGTFRSTLSQYVAFRAEIQNQFNHETYARNYSQIEEEYNQWPRKYPLTWSAHQSAEQLLKDAGRILPDLSYGLIGARHFERIRRVFFHMILTYQPADKNLGWMESAGSLLHGITADHENAEKMARELLYSYISETFALGICWLTQIYSFLLEHFEKHVHEVLSSNIGGFTSLSRGHEKFFHLLRLEYHQTTRKMIRHAIEASRYARHAKMTYASHNICNYLRTLMENIPPSVRSESGPQISIVDSDPRRLIFNTDTFLPSKRDAQTSNFVPTTKNVVHELLTTVRALLLHDITTSFFANVVTQIHEYKSITIPNSLESRIAQMSKDQIAHLSQINIEEQIQDLENTFEKLEALEEAEAELDRAIRIFDGKKEIRWDERRDESRLILLERRKRRHLEVMRKVSDVQKNQSDVEFIHDELHGAEPKGEEEQLKAKLNDDPTSGQMYLGEFFEKHDLEDLKFGLLQGEHLHMNKNKETSSKAAPSAIPKSGSRPNGFHIPEVTPPQTRTMNGSPPNDSSIKPSDATTSKPGSPKEKSKWYDRNPLSKK